MKTIKSLIGAFLLMAPMALQSQSKNDMPITGKPEAGQLLRQAWVMYGDVKFEDGNKLAQQAVDKDPACALAYVFLFSANEQEFEQHVVKARGMNLSTDEKLLVDGIMASVKNDKPAQEFFNPLLKKYPKDDLLQLHSLYNVRDVTWRVQTGEALVKRSPKFAPGFNILGYAYMDANALPKAEAAFDKYIVLRPELANVYDSKGDYMMRVENFKEAAALYEKAAGMGMTSSKVRAQRAAARMKYPNLTAEETENLKKIVTLSGQEFLKGNLDAFFTYYADQSIEIFNNQRANVSKANCRKRVEQVFRNGGFTKLTFDSMRAGGAGPIGLVWGKSDGTYKPNNGTEQVDNGNVIFLFRKQKDGTWQILADHFFQASPKATAADEVAVRKVMNDWNNSFKPNEAMTEKHHDALAALYSSQAIELTPNQFANIGTGNLKARWHDLLGQHVQLASLGPIQVSVIGRRAVAWGVAIQNSYQTDPAKVTEAAFPWAFIFTKEKDDVWRILAIHWAQ